MKGKPKPLPDLLALNRNAATVYLAIRWLAGDRRQVNTTRAKIAAVCGLCKRAITDAVQALGECGWVRVSYGRQGLRSWYRLTLNAGVSWIFPVCHKTTHREAKSVSKKGTQGTSRCVPKNVPHIRKYVERASASKPTPRPHEEIEPPAENPIARLEREAMERIRAARLAAESTPTQPADVAGVA